MRTRTIVLTMLAAGIFLSGCGQKVDVVDSGTYQGTIAEVKPDEEEIYVNLDSGKTIELYFTDDTELLQDGGSAPFSVLEKGQTVSVQVERVGNRLDPVNVEILSD